MVMLKKNSTYRRLVMNVSSFQPSQQYSVFLELITAARIMKRRCSSGASSASFTEGSLGTGRGRISPEWQPRIYISFSSRPTATRLKFVVAHEYELAWEHVEWGQFWPTRTGLLGKIFPGIFFFLSLMFMRFHTINCNVVEEYIHKCRTFMATRCLALCATAPHLNVLLVLLQIDVAHILICSLCQLCLWSLATCRLRAVTDDCNAPCTCDNHTPASYKCSNLKWGKNVSYGVTVFSVFPAQ